MKDYDTVHHLPGDTFDKVDSHGLSAGAAIIAVTAYSIAERAEPIAPRLDRQAVDRMMAADGMSAYVREIVGWH